MLAPMFQLYRNQSINLHDKSINWFLYEWNIGTKFSSSFEILFPYTVLTLIKSILNNT